MGAFASVADDFRTILRHKTGRTRIRGVDLNLTGACSYDCIMCVNRTGFSGELFT